MTPSVKQNFAFNLINTLLKIVFPLLVFPYVSRTLLPEGIGRVNYAEAFVNYFVLFAAMGIPVYGIREIARYRQETEVLKIKLVQIFSINLVFMLASLGVLTILIASGVISNEVNLIIIFSSLLIFSLIDMEWFYQGTENYKFITMRNVIVKCTTLILIYSMVKSTADVKTYALLLVFGIGGNSVFNFTFILRKYGKTFFKIFQKEFIIQAFRDHARSILITSSMALAGSIYLSLDVIMLGNLADNVQVGYYAASMKIVRVVISIVLALTTVLLPRASLHVKNKNHTDFIRLFDLGFRFILLIALPCMAGIQLLSEPLMVMFAGDKFQQAHLVIKSLSFLIILAGLNNLLGMQVLYPLQKEKQFLLAILAGATSSVILNLVLIPMYGAAGAALSAVSAELIIFTILIYHSKMYFKELSLGKTLVYFSATSIMAVVIMLLKNLLFPLTTVQLVLLVMTSGAVYISVLILMRESDFIKPLWNMVKSKMGGKSESN
jgi:O-antigen/teichoic acid export membrane protein